MINEERRALHRIAVKKNAKTALKPGDRLRVTKCPGTKRWIIFAKWDGDEVISKSGRGGYYPRGIDKVNRRSVDFTKGQKHD